jgi:hypothetical protein
VWTSRVEDGVGDGRVGDRVVPVVDGELAGDYGSGTAMTVVDDLEDVAALLGGHGRQTPVVEDQQRPGAAGIALARTEKRLCSSEILLKLRTEPSPANNRPTACAASGFLLRGSYPITSVYSTQLASTTT